MGSCSCEPPATLHLRPEGVHLPDGSETNLIVVDDTWNGADLSCSVCAVSIPDTYYRCVPCDAAICRACLSSDTVVAECDCFKELNVTGVQLAARIAAAAHAG